MVGFLDPHRYGFLNAKVSAIKSKMLKSSDYAAIVELEDVNQIIEKLARTYYKDYLTKLSPYLSGSQLVEAASRKWLAEIYLRLAKYIPSDDRILAYALMNRHEIRNLSLLISAKIKGRSWENIEELIFPLNDLVYYRRFYREENIYKALKYIPMGRNVLSLEISNIWKGRENVMNSLLKGGNMLVYLLATLELYHAYYLKEYLSKYKNIFAVKLLFREKDIRNISVMLRFKAENKGLEEYLENVLLGGELGEYELLKAYKNKDFLDYIIKKYKANPLDDYYKIEFDMYLEILKSKRKSMKKILSLDRVAGFFLYAESEIELINLISRGKEMNIGNKYLKELITNE